MRVNGVQTRRNQIRPLPLITPTRNPGWSGQYEYPHVHTHTHTHLNKRRTHTAAAVTTASFSFYSNPVSAERFWALCNGPQPPPPHLLLLLLPPVHISTALCGALWSSWSCDNQTHSAVSALTVGPLLSLWNPGNSDARGVERVVFARRQQQTCLNGLD